MEYYMGSSATLLSETFPSCRICIITLACGKPFAGPNIRIRSNRQSCNRLLATKLRVYLPEPLASVLISLPSFDYLPSYTTETQVNNVLAVSDANFIVTIQQLAQPLIMKMAAMDTSFKDKFESFANIRTILVLGVFFYFCGASYSVSILIL